VKDQLEAEFQCQSYSLVPFSEEDQKHFLVKFWKMTCPDIKSDYLENLANRVVGFSAEHLNVQDKKFMGIPLQSLLLAEMFEGNLKECSTSTKVELPENINLVIFYDLYMNKKWDSYLSDRKLSDRTNVNVLTDDDDDDDAIHKTFIHNHTAAAVVAILSTQQLEKLTDKTIAERAREFLQKIAEGMEEIGIIIDVIEGRPVFQHRTLADYLTARWLCDNFQNGQTFMKDHLFESGFHVVRSMVDRILAEKYPLHEAVINSSLKQVEKLLRMKESLTEKDRGGRTPLHVAVSCRTPELIKLLLEHGADVSSVDTLLGLSPVEYAIRMDDWEMLSLLMEKRPGIREQVLNGAKCGCTDSVACALRTAAQYGHTDLLKYLISKGSFVNVALPWDNSSLLHVAARSQQTETLKLLLLLGANIDRQDESGKTPLHVSVETGNLEVIKCLLKHGADVNAMNSAYQTPLQIAASQGKQVVRELLNYGASVDSVNNNGWTPLNTVANKGHVEVVQELMKHGANVDRVNNGGWAPLNVAAKGHMEVARELLNRGSSVDSVNDHGWTPLNTAAKGGHVEVVRELLKHGAVVDSVNDNGWTPLNTAAKEGHMEVVRELLKHGASLGSVNNDGWRPLNTAAFEGHVEVVRELLKHGASVDSVNNNGFTPLNAAAKGGHVEVVRELLKHGASVDSVNNNGFTPLNSTANEGHVEVV